MIYALYDAGGIAWLAAMASDRPGDHIAPNIPEAPDLYEIENRAVDPEGRIEAATVDRRRSVYSGGYEALSTRLFAAGPGGDGREAGRARLGTQRPWRSD